MERPNPWAGGGGGEGGNVGCTIPGAGGGMWPSHPIGWGPKMKKKEQELSTKRHSSRLPGANVIDYLKLSLPCLPAMRNCAFKL